jgi:UDP-N-acetylmuramate--alanine ligase
MTSLAQLLGDAGKQVRGSDVAEDFPTRIQLERLGITPDTQFETPLPENIDCVIYTGAHNGRQNPQVRWAQANGLPTYTHAEALGFFFNQKKGIAVCGVGGKSTISAMIVWALQSIGLFPSFAVGVGDIPGIGKTGAWTNSPYFVAEADEYVEDPSTVDPAKPIVPRFTHLKPFITVCSNLRFDHPDVYRDFQHTRKVFQQFFEQTDPTGTLLVNADDAVLLKLAQQSHPHVMTYGENVTADFRLTSYLSHLGKTQAVFEHLGRPYSFSLSIPGKFNVMNALAAIAASTLVDERALEQHALENFRSTARRFENKGEINGVQCYDDYAHHPHEVKAAIDALKEWYPEAKKVVAFQSHTYSRTKKLFDEFTDAFEGADEVVMTDIFASAREKSDTSVSSTLLCEAIEKKFSHIPAKNFGTNKKLAAYLREHLKPGNVLLTLGAGDIYEIYELLKKA